MVYLIKAAGLYKIGYSSNLPQRLKALQSATADKLEIVASWPGSLITEHRAHQKFASKRVHGEWFELNDQDLEALNLFLQPREVKPKRRGRPSPNYWPRPCHWCARMPHMNSEGEVYCVCGWRYDSGQPGGRGSAVEYLEDDVREELPPATS